MTDPGGLRAERVSWRYDDDSPLVLKRVSLDVQPGECTLLTGPSGCGKSSLAMIMAGLLTGHGGSATIDQTPVGTMSPADRARRIGVVFQNPDLQFCMDTLRNELVFCLENLSVEPVDMDHRIEETAALTGVTALLDRPLHGLSGGEKQRASLTSALIGGADTLILDEPFSNLDPIAVDAMIQLLGRVREQRALTILAIDHRPYSWIGLADQVMAFVDGDVRAIPMPDPPRHAALRPVPTAPPVVQMRDVTISVGGTRTWRQRLRRQSGTRARELLKIGKLDVHAGEIVALMGPSGSGKSTLLRSIVRLHPCIGEIMVDGRSINQIKPQDIGQVMGLAFQNPSDQFIALTVSDDVAIGLRRAAPAAEPDASHIEQLLSDFRLAGTADRSPYTLSQGQQRRLAVLGMIAAEQRVLLLDEPTYGQDDASIHAMMSVIDERARSSGLAVLMTTHDDHVAREWAHRIIRIVEGTLTEEVTP